MTTTGDFLTEMTKRERAGMSVDFEGVAEDFAVATIRLVTEQDWNAEDPEYGRTPERFLDLMRELLCRHADPRPTMTTFESQANELIICDPIDFYSLCPHHLALIF